MNTASTSLALVTAFLSVAIGTALGWRTVRFLVRRFRDKLYARENRTVRHLRLFGYRDLNISDEGLKEELKKMREPTFAIGQGLITHEEKAAFEGRYLAQSELSLGLIIPVSLLMCSVASRLDVTWRVYIVVGVFAAVASYAFFVLGIERLYRFQLEIQSLVLGRLEKRTDDLFLERSGQ